MKHWIGMAGLTGCIPSVCDIYRCKADAAKILCLIHEYSENGSVVAELKRYGIFYMPKGRGNEYMSVEECNCPSPWEHADELDSDAFDVIRTIDNLRSVAKTCLMHDCIDAMAEKLAQYILE